MAPAFGQDLSEEKVAPSLQPYFSLSLLQPAKLAEAFKYFVQGMGYSKYGIPPPWEKCGRGNVTHWPSLNETPLSPRPEIAFWTLGRAEKEIFTVVCG